MRHLDDEDLDKIGALLDLKILERLEQIMATVQDALDVLTKVNTDLDALIAEKAATDTQPIVDAANAIDAKITAATTPPA